MEAQMKEYARRLEKLKTKSKPTSNEGTRDAKRQLHDAGSPGFKKPRHAPSSVSSSDSKGAPHFLIIGAQKAGTMAAVKNMNKHPEVGVLSEVHYFDLGWNKHSPQWYRNLFKQNPKRVMGEKTPELMYVDECALRIKQICPNAKFIMFVRDPVKRAYSGWNMNISKGWEVAPFDECVNRNLQNINDYRSFGTAETHYVQRGFYMDQIDRLAKVFPEILDANNDRLLIVVSEHIQKDPVTQYRRIFDFLGVSNTTIECEDDHKGSYSTPMSTSIEKKLYRVYKPHNERLFRFLGYRIPEWGGDGDLSVRATNTVINDDPGSLSTGDMTKERVSADPQGSSGPSAAQVVSESDTDACADALGGDRNA
jgi:hypothetical protein